MPQYGGSSSGGSFNTVARLGGGASHVVHNFKKKLAAEGRENLFFCTKKVKKVKKVNKKQKFSGLASGGKF